MDPEKVHGADHHGTWFDVPGPALTHPGPQRTPLLFQAGSSARGQQFAVHHGEAIFVINADPQKVARQVDSTKAALVESGRHADSVRFSAMATVIVGETSQEATQRWEDYCSYVDTEAALALFAEFISIGGRGPTFVGDPGEIADQLVQYRDISGVDGFNISAAVRPADLERFCALVTPELRRRGLLAPRPEQPVALREALLGQGPHLAADHLAQRLRRTAVAPR